MKKTFTFLLCGLAAFAFSACNDSGNGGEEPAKETFTFSDNNIEFTIFGGVSEITVTGKDNAVVEFSVIPTGEWFEMDKTGNKLTITTDLNEAGAKEGSIKISAEGYEDAVINLSQAAPAAVLWDNPSAYYMNLKRSVKSVSFHDYLMRSVSVESLEFNEKGWLTFYKIGSERTVTINYDAQNRISEIDFSRTMTSPAGKLKLSYDTHGHYISMEDLFFKELAYNAAVLEYETWMPLFIKDLSKVELVANDVIELTYQITITGNQGSCILDGDDEDPVFTFTTANKFFATSIYGSGFYASESTYFLDFATGKLTKIEIEDPWGAMTYNFNPDRMNSFASVESDDMPSAAVYNSNLDVESIDTDEYEYTYDDHNNWTARTKNGAEDKTRTIVYWD